MKKFALRLACVLAILLTCSCTKHKGSFLLVNKAQEPIVHASVVICGQRIELNDINPNKMGKGSYMVRSDSGYAVQIEFLSGKKLSKEVGYVTSGMDFKDKIFVTDSDIEIDQ